MHLGFLRSSDEYKVMAMASYGRPRHRYCLRRLVHATPGRRVRHRAGGLGGAWPRARTGGEEFDERHADLAASVQLVLEETLLELASQLHRRTGQTRLAFAGGVALNCVANTRLLYEGPFDDLWVQPAAGDAGTALGAALSVAVDAGETLRPFRSADLGPSWSEAELEAILTTARVRYERPADIAVATAEIIAANGVVAWFQGRSEFGPRALGHRSLLADPTRSDNVERLNDIKGREQFRPVAPMVLLERAAELFERGPIPSPYMLFVHDVRPAWRDRLPGVTHIDGTARAQTVDPADDPLTARLLTAFADRTGVPVLVNTSLNTAGRPMVDSPRDALELFGSAPVDALAIGPFLVRR